ncbi:phosphatase PAP2 family protein [Flaviaesturariibacter amylovorans]|uniref:Phosphatase PAP2 family protein n=1 Tax=Flaviaesturariibacter amylovorans TaxID=1084520 RepID=A0ABP8HDY9_9BACT
MIRKLSGKVRRFWASLALLSVEMVLLAAVFLVSLTVFGYMVRRVFVLQNNDFDQQVFDYLGGWVTPGLNRFMQAVTFLGTHRFLIPANLSLIAWFLFVRPHKWYSIKVPAIALSSLLLMSLLKNLFGRSRPLDPLLEPARGLSFPSGHALMSMTFYGLLIYITYHSVKNPRLRWPIIAFLGLLILTISFSRIYLRVHYTSDVLAGLALGALWVVLALKLIRRIEKQGKRTLGPIVGHGPAPTMGTGPVPNAPSEPM